MASTFHSVAFSNRVQLEQVGVSLTLSHSQQLLAAALGYRTLAAWQAVPDEVHALQQADFVVFDLPTLKQRCLALGHAAHLDQIVGALAGCIVQACPTVKVFRDLGLFVDEVVEPFVRDAIELDEGVCNAMASTNAYLDDPAEFEVARDESSIGTSSDEFVELPVEGTITMTPDPDRMYSGHIIEFDGVVRVFRVGKRCFCEPLELDLGASVDDSHIDTDATISILDA